MKHTSTHWKKLRAWWTTFLGQSFITAEEGAIKKIIPSWFGYQFLLLGESCFVQCIPGSSTTLHKVWVNPHADPQKDCSALSGRFDKLPIISDGIDLVYLAHALEFIKNPHEVLRETFRVLIPEGYVLISNFNPWSLWGLWHGLVHFIKRPVGDRRFISMARLKDWLALLGFDTVGVVSYFFRPPIAHPKILKRLEWLEKLGRWGWPFWGGGYVVLARKRVITLTPIRPQFRIKRDKLVTGMIEPARSE